jgi:hypothetical protein
MSDHEPHPHPWYGSCDGFLDDEGCAECAMIADEPTYAAAKAEWWRVTQERWALRAEKKARRKARRQCPGESA